MKPFPCIESTIEVTRGKVTVRLWIDQQALPNDQHLLRLPSLVGLVESALGIHLDPRHPGEHVSDGNIIQYLCAAIPQINAVQVVRHLPRINTDQFGTVVYTVPFEDAHG